MRLRRLTIVNGVQRVRWLHLTTSASDSVSDLAAPDYFGIDLLRQSNG
jgi:hypothetical protein